MPEIIEKLTDTWKTAPKRPVSVISQQACLVHIYPTGPGMGVRYPLGTATLSVGRDPDCQIRLVDQSVSRHHADIQLALDGYHITDLKSTNGTFVNDEPVTARRLRDGDYVRIGNWIFRYLAGGNVEAEYHEEIYRMTIMDGLTGVPNRRFFLEFLDRELARAVRHKRPLAIVLCDVDQFKVINDSLGHLAGDWTLKELASRIKRAIRREELFARYGGEEFSMVLPETPREGAILMAERVRRLVADAPFHYEGRPFPVTISLGVAAITDGVRVNSAELIRHADEKLYEAKRAGRNCLRA
jgi:diguanylate cyclase (GGDEF)-like protein